MNNYLANSIGANDENLSKFAALMPAGIFSCNAEGRITFFNRRATELWGRTPEMNERLEHFYRSFKIFFVDGTPISVNEMPMLVALRNGRQHRDIEAIFWRQDGSRFVARINIDLLYDANGKICGAISVFEDVTHHKRSEQAAQQLAAIVESSDDAIISKDFNGIITSWNHGAERIFGYTASEVIGKSITILIPKDRRDEETVILAKIRRGEAIEHYETLRCRKDGRLIDISLTISPIRAANGKIIGASKIARDVTEKKRDEETQHVLYELVAEMNRGMELPKIYDAAINAILRCQNADRASILLYDDEFVMRFKAWRNLSDDYRRAVEGHSPWKVNDPSPQPVFIGDVSKVELDEHLREVVTREGIRALVFIPIAYENRLLGKFMIYYDAPHDFSSEEIRPAQTVARQIAFAIERKRVETELKRARDEAQRANRAKDDFLAALSHELRTPLNPVLLVASDSANDLSLTPRVRQAFDMIRKNVELEARLIDDLLDISRITCGKLAMEMDLVDVHAAVCAALEKVQSDLGQKEIGLKLNLNAPDFGVRGDAVRLQQVFWNILKNAVKFTPPRGNIAVTSRMEKDELLVCISDSGIGMTREELTLSFDAFSQGENVSSSQFGGLGLGLAICRSIVGAHFGRIWAESDGRDKGSAFFITLPLEKVAKRMNGIPKRNGKRMNTKTQKQSLCILLVEDHEPTRNSLKELLTRRHHKVAAAATVSEARSLAGKKKFDVLISDIGLPDGNGADLMRELGADKNLKGIALTGYGMEQDMEKSQSAGFAAHLTKPVRIDSLDTALAEIF